MSDASNGLTALAPSLAMLASFACLAGGLWQIRRGDRQKGLLLIVAALVMIGNVIIWTL